jgi:hypothetical protein
VQARSLGSIFDAGVDPLKANAFAKSFSVALGAQK